MRLDEFKKMVGQYTWVNREEQDAMEASLRAQGVDWSNLYQELEMSDRYVNTHRDATYGGLVPLHSHSFYEFLYCEEASGTEYLVGAERYTLRRGDVIYVRPGVSHRPILPETMETPYRRDVLWVSEGFVAELRKRFPDFGRESAKHPSLLRTEGTPMEEEIRARFRAGIRESEERPLNWQAAVEGNTVVLMALLQRVMEQRHGPLVQAEEPELLDRVLAYIEEHLSEPIALSDVARRFWVSESTIGQTFRGKLGVSFYRCVTQRRLIEAKSLILQGTTLGEVGERVGFSDYSSFFRAFKREFGVSPREFRKLRD